MLKHGPNNWGAKCAKPFIRPRNNSKDWDKASKKECHKLNLTFTHGLSNSCVRFINSFAITQLPNALELLIFHPRTLNKQRQNNKILRQNPKHDKFNRHLWSLMKPNASKHELAEKADRQEFYFIMLLENALFPTRG